MSEFAEPDPADLDRDLDDVDPEDTDLEADDILDDEPTPRDDADDADVLEQATPVRGVDDDYPFDVEVEPDV